jgi:hypothetical protein
LRVCYCDSQPPGRSISSLTSTCLVTSSAKGESGVGLWTQESLSKSAVIVKRRVEGRGRERLGVRYELAPRAVGQVRRYGSGAYSPTIPWKRHLSAAPRQLGMHNRRNRRNRKHTSVRPTTIMDACSVINFSRNPCRKNNGRTRTSASLRVTGPSSRQSLSLSRNSERSGPLTRHQRFEESVD